MKKLTRQDALLKLFIKLGGKSDLQKIYTKVAIDLKKFNLVQRDKIKPKKGDPPFKKKIRSCLTPLANNDFLMSSEEYATWEITQEGIHYIKDKCGLTSNENRKLKKNEQLLEDAHDIPKTEGGKKVTNSTIRKRNQLLRNQAMKYHKLNCKVCGFNFEKTYGQWGKNFIEVHHIFQLAKNKKEIKTDYKTHLTVVCSNCHRMIHRRKYEPLTTDELKEKIKKAKKIN